MQEEGAAVQTAITGSATAGHFRETDLEVIDAMQLNPRASWKDLGHVLGIDPATVSRRWQRLEEAGEAWVTVALGQRQLNTMCVAFLELSCEPGAASEVGAALAAEPHVISLQHVAGSYDLWGIVLAPRLTDLSDYLLRRLPLHKGVTRVRTHVATRVYDASGRWRLRVLNRDQVRRLIPKVPPTDRLDSLSLEPADRELFVALSTDGRRTYRELEARLGINARTVQRRLGRLLATGDIAFRCDLARARAGWHAGAVLWLSLPDDRLDATGRRLLEWPQTRTCAAVTGASNMLLTVGLHALSDLHELGTRIRAEFPYAVITDRTTTLRQIKLYGRLLDPTGRCAPTAVPVDPWALSPDVASADALSR
ncbi:Lrp/AsnC family transcriptional regulator [Streptomyces sp. NPDC000880]